MCKCISLLWEMKKVSLSGFKKWKHEFESLITRIEKVETRMKGISNTNFKHELHEF